MSEQRFWVVWQPETGAPTYRHTTIESATEEAERLADVSPRLHFYVLEAVSVAKKVSVVTVPLVDPYDDLPF